MYPQQMQETEIKVSMELKYLFTMDLIYENLSHKAHCGLQLDTNSPAVL